ncbi:MAG: hypothetical protein GQ574_22655 [Crocinitomix sp.]|nr:hypothetical protein [Crocinitomix sp.]
MLVIFIIVILALLIGDLTKKKSSSDKAEICTGCSIEMKEEFIRVSGQNLIQPLHYCSEQCKIDHIDRDRLKFAEIDLSR